MNDKERAAEIARVRAQILKLHETQTPRDSKSAPDFGKGGKK